MTDELRIAPEAAEELLARLAADDEFRARLEAAPVEVLAEYGIAVAARPVALPSKDDVVAALRRMRPRELAAEWMSAPARAKFSPLAG
jgi:putative modified peptide